MLRGSINTDKMRNLSCQIGKFMANLDVSQANSYSLHPVKGDERINQAVLRKDVYNSHRCPIRSIDVN